MIEGQGSAGGGRAALAAAALLQCCSKHPACCPSLPPSTSLQVFSKVGDVKRIVMGLDKHRHTPCGFCFVEFYNREDAENSMRFLNGTR